MVVEEVDKIEEEQPKKGIDTGNTIEVPPETEPHIEPGIHEEITDKPSEPPASIPLPSKQLSGPNPLVIIIPGIFLLGALLGGIFFYQSSVNKKINPTPTPTNQQLESTSPTATPQATEVDLTKYPISILNGSGIKGEAGKTQELLEKAGFKVSGVGNASNYSYTETVIQAKSTIDKEFITKLSQTLEENYKVASKTQSLTSSSKDDVVVIVGNSKK